MKLAEALQERADLNRRIEQLSARLSTNATVQEGEKTPEDPAALLEEMNGCICRLETLMAQINHRNCATVVEGSTLTELIARRDCLTRRIQVYRKILDEASSITRRATRSEIKIVSAVDVRALQKEADALSRQLRETDNLIQQTNWVTDL